MQSHARKGTYRDAGHYATIPGREHTEMQLGHYATIPGREHTEMQGITLQYQEGNTEMQDIILQYQEVKNIGRDAYWTWEQREAGR